MSSRSLSVLWKKKNSLFTMGSIVLYIIEWAFALLLLLTLYKAVFSGTTFYRFNRFYLLGATLLSALLPLLHFTISDDTSVVNEVAISGTVFARELTGVHSIMGPEITVTPDAQEIAHGHSLWAIILVCSYAVYVLMLVIGWTRGVVKAHRFLRGKPRRHISRAIWLVTHNEQFGPFSWMNYIVISDRENGFARKASLRHEFAHIRLMHSIDLIILLACTILNPVCWLVLQEIKIVHEFQADDEVINRYGIEGKDYQRLLIMRTVGAEAYALANSFNLNIKKRIIMMNKKKTLRRRFMWLLLLIPLLGMTSVLFARTDNKADKTPTQVKISEGDIITGRVIDTDGPIFMARIFEVDLRGRIFASSITDPEGNFAFKLVNPDDMILVTKDGYEDFKGVIDSKEITITLKKADAESLQVEDKQEEAMVVVEEMPGFPGGLFVLMQYLNDNIQYPDKAKNDGVEGRVVVSFIVGKEGLIKDAQVEKSVDPELDAEAIRVVAGMPRWTPGKSHGEPVDVKYSIPINFQLTQPQQEQSSPFDEIIPVSSPEEMEKEHDTFEISERDKKVIEDTYDNVEIMPEFPGGVQGLLNYMRETIKYPAQARQDTIQGRVLVTFVINKDGSIVEPEVVKSAHPLLDQEALKMVKEMPNWKPGEQNGKPVRVKYTIPVNFRLN